MATIKDFVHKGNYGQPNLDRKRCAFSVHEKGRGVGVYQCMNGIKEEIDGFGFCTVHAKEVKRRLGRLGEGMVRYAAGVSYGKPILAKLIVEKETEKTIYIQNVEELMGHTFVLGSGLQNKRNPYLREYKFFDEKISALKYIDQKLNNMILRLEKELEEAGSVYETFHKMYVKASKEL